MPTDSKVRALVFDIGEVIVRVNAWRAARSIAAHSSVGPRRLLQFIQQHGRLRDFQEGHLSIREWHSDFRNQLGLRMALREFRAAWNSALDSKTILDESLFAQLAKRYRLVLLSNTDPIHVAHLERSYQFPRYFRHQLYSCALGASKPDPAVYHEAIMCAGVEPGHILYTDDVPEYVEAGRKAGMQAVRFESRSKFYAELRERGVPPDRP